MQNAGLLDSSWEKTMLGEDHVGMFYLCFQRLSKDTRLICLVTRSSNGCCDLSLMQIKQWGELDRCGVVHFLGLDSPILSTLYFNTGTYKPYIFGEQTRSIVIFYSKWPNNPALISFLIWKQFSSIFSLLINIWTRWMPDFINNSVNAWATLEADLAFREPVNPASWSNFNVLPINRWLHWPLYKRWSICYFIILALSRRFTWVASCNYRAIIY